MPTHIDVLCGNYKAVIDRNELATIADRMLPTVVSIAEQGQTSAGTGSGFIVLAATLNFGFFIGDIERPELHHLYELAAALIVSLIATVLKFGDRTQIGAIHLATSLVAVIQLVWAAGLWIWYTQALGAGELLTTHQMSSVVSVALGALLANIVSVVLMVIETANFRRH